MKYVEQIKSIALVVLIFLSLALTFTIWTFTPSLDPIETSSSAVDVLIGDTKTLDQVMQPHKVLYQYEDSVTGTTSADQIDALLRSMRQWQIQDLALNAEEAGTDRMASLMHDPERAVIYYPAPVPFPVFDTVMDIDDSSVPEATFDRMVIDWGTARDNELSVYFLNSNSGRIYEGNAVATELETFRTNVIDPAYSYGAYISDENIGELPIYVPEEPVDETIYTYLYDEVATERFAEGLFTGNSVEPANNLTNGEYADETGAFLNRDTNSKSINFVQSKAETSDPAIPSELIFSTFGFINDHGGWTNEYHYFGMQPLDQQIRYQMFINNLPVFGANNLATKLEVRWGISGGMEQVFRYIRPVYMLEPTGRTVTKEQAAGKTALAALNRLDDSERAAITDIIPSYSLARNSGDPERLMQLEPTWHFQMDGEWLELTNEVIGGEQFGLE